MTAIDVSTAPRADRRKRSAPPAPEMMAAVDLGSNSFHMVIARVVAGDLQTVGRLKEKVQLAAGLDQHHLLTAEAMARALECLKRFGQRLKGMAPGSVRAVGTNTLRMARNGRAFLAQASEVLGHPIDIIAGREEARLIYSGVAHTLPDAGGQRLVIDIGGGSTEFIIGKGYEPLLLDSLHMGCVSYERFFPEGRIERKGFKAAVTAARLELMSIQDSYPALGWQHCVGSSGTIQSIQEILIAQGHHDGLITLDRLNALRERVEDAGHESRLNLPGLKEERRSILPAGLAVLYAIFKSLPIATMSTSDAALREGVLYELAGRFQHQDVRERTAQAMAARYHVDQAQAARVRATALDFLTQVAEDWDLAGEEQEIMLSWAANLHEVGLSISYSQYQKHGDYILTHADMPGFTRSQQELLAALVRNHRRKLSPARFEVLPAEAREPALRLTRLLRLAALLHHRRIDESLPALELRAADKSLSLSFPDGWLAEHSLVEADLEQEAAFCAAAGLRLSFA
ncbi:MAG: exopolyphosphatase [Gammaproteobacteria bacterium]|nr:exopolyphosphatase [Gammaproteobacteria bacterium]